MPLLPFDLPPGVFANGTEYQSKGRWRAAQLIRFREGMIKAVGGWVSLLIGTSSTPDQISGLVLWLNGPTLAGSDGDAVATWPDSSGHGNDATQSVGANRPAIKKNMFGTGLHGVQFGNLGGDPYAWLTLPNVMGAATSGEAFAVMKQYDSPVTADRYMLWQFGKSTSGAQIPDNVNRIYDDFGDADTGSAPQYGTVPAGVDITQPFIYNVSLGSIVQGGTTLVNAVQPRMNNNVTGAAASLASPGWTTTPRIGAVDAVYRGCYGIAEIIVFNRKLTDDERGRVLNYLASRYSITLASLSTNEVVRTLLGWRAKSTAGPILAVGSNASIHTYTQGTLTDRTPSDITPGTVSATMNFGGSFGTGPYGAGAYGVGDTTQGALIDPGVWSFDAFGDYLVGVLAPSDGRLLIWDTLTDKMVTVAQYAANYGLTVTTPPDTSTVPQDLAGVVVTPERFLLALGVDGDGRKIRWPSQETLHDWNPNALNTAGSMNLPGNGRIICGRRGRGETLIWTDEDFFTMQYIGGTLVYALNQPGSKCGAISKNAVAVIDGRAVWMGRKSFFIYDGYVKPVPSEVSDYVFSNFNTTQRSKCFARTVADQNEVHFHWCSLTSDEPDQYIIWNYVENHWTPGTNARSAGIDRGAFDYPICAAGSALYEHEKGTSHSGAVAPFLESGPVEIMGFDQGTFMRTAGATVMTVLELLPDSTNAGQALGNLQLRLYGRFYPDGAESAYGPFTLANPTPLRLSARQVRVHVEEIQEGDWRLGVMRLRAEAGGRR
jgi:hypothetical protein